MTLTDGVLWQAQDQGRNWRRWILRATVTALVAVGGLLAAVTGWPVHGSVVAGGAVLVGLLGFGYWLGDRRKVIEIRSVSGTAPELRLRTVTGRVDQVAVADVGNIRLLTRISPYDPDIAFRSYRTTLTLELRGGRSYRCRRISEFTTTGPVEGAKEHWQSLFPAARVTAEARFDGSGTGD
ncbi:hypothetical protein ACFQY4_16840 [Catellatospora bangladeshensis]|uniref:Uncharacterized protein n=1 Tax=Catellatospora bangladeshensis TaxID=310355 RepID=A0A8J3NKN8_9ACTN|nr:hypothetical protein [Catellatospora bangladeshensis]GIF84222.1 hypothetical protein Cba03nite_55710 [Catellatospora bangladeshensis]